MVLPHHINPWTTGIKFINKEIVNGLSILERFKSLKVHQGNYGNGMAVIGAYPKPQINPEERAALNRDLTLWERRVYDVLKCYFFSFLIKGFEYNDMEGGINQRAIPSNWK